MPNSPPDDDQVELTFFGPGYGESILIHTGGNKWIIVDSCVDKLHRPAPLVYLNQIGVNPAQAVEYIIATHWHDDHVRGLSEIFDVCETAKFVCSQSISGINFRNLITAYGNGPTVKNSSGTFEFLTIFKKLKERGKFPILASADRPISNNEIEHSAPFSCKFWSLSPSDAANLKALVAISELLPQKQKPKKRLPPPDHNDTAVVLLLSFGEENVLLGADLEEEVSDGTMGWSAIVNSTTRPREKCCIFKIPHHGSPNGDYPPVWDEMLINSPFAVLTPFKNGKVSLPLSDDILRIVQRTEKAFSTSTGKQRRVKHSSPFVRKMVKKATNQIREVGYSSGYVRLRAYPARRSSWQVQLFNDACPLYELLKTG